MSEGRRAGDLCLPIPQALQERLKGIGRLREAVLAGTHIHAVVELDDGGRVSLALTPARPARRDHAFACNDFGVRPLPPGHEPVDESVRKRCRTLGTLLAPEGPVVRAWLEAVTPLGADALPDVRDPAGPAARRVLRLADLRRRLQAPASLLLEADYGDDELLAERCLTDLVTGDVAAGLWRSDRLRPDDSQVIAHYARAVTFALEGRLDDAAQARTAFIEAAASAPALGSTPDQRRTFAATLAAELAMACEAPDEAAQRLQEALGPEADVPDLMRLARASLAAGQPADAQRTLLALLARAGVEQAGELGSLLEQAGEFEAASGAYARALADERVADEARRALVRLALWRGDLVEVRRHLPLLDPAAEPALRPLLLGALAVLEGRFEEALLHLSRVEAAPDPAELHLWRAEAEWGAGRRRAAHQEVVYSQMVHNTLQADLLLARLSLPARKGLRSLTDALRPLVRLITRANVPAWMGPHLRERLATLRLPNEPRTFETAADTRVVVDRLWEELGGNRSQTPTRRVTDARGGVTLASWPASESGREAASNLLRRVGRDSPAEVLRAFDEVAARFPRSPHPFTYRGELLLWLGEYDAATAAFEASMRRSHTRWGYVGLSAVLLLHGEMLAASRVARKGVQRFGDLDSATTYVYRGELRRRQGDLAGAREDLELAVKHRPGRVAARMNLVLTLRALGRHDDAAREARVVRSSVPGILKLAARAVGATVGQDTSDLVLEQALVLMRGNRSSWKYTLVDPEGQFRVFPSSAPLLAATARARPWLERSLLVSMAETVLEEQGISLSLDGAARHRRGSSAR